MAQQAPTWLRDRVPTDWYDRYGQLIENARLPKTDAARNALATTIGEDGFTLLAWIAAPATPMGVTELPAVQILRQLWADQYTVVDGRV